jgi:hypothetical protein
MSDAPLYDWLHEPFVLSIRDMARILRRSTRTIEREIAAGTMTPAPMPKMGKTTPHQWSRLEVQRYLEGGYRKHDPMGKRRYFGKATA